MSERKIPKVVVMGVSGCGKSLTGTRLAQELGVPFYDADDYHSRANVEKMAAGIPLTDEDRLGWLDDLAELIRREESGLVLACSALKRAYRERLQRRNPETCFVYLKEILKPSGRGIPGGRIIISTAAPCWKVSFNFWRNQGRMKTLLPSMYLARRSR